MLRFARKTHSSGSNTERAAAVGIIFSFFAFVFVLWTFDVSGTLFTGSVLEGLSEGERLESDRVLSQAGALQNEAGGKLSSEIVVESPQETAEVPTPSTDISFEAAINDTQSQQNVGEMFEIVERVSVLEE